MKKIFKTALLLFLLVFLFSVSANASEDYYNNQYESFGIGGLKDVLTDDASELLDDMEINPENSDWTDSVTAENIFSHIISFLLSGAGEFKSALFSIIGISVISAAAGCISGEEKESGTLISYVSVLCICTVAVIPVFRHISSVVAAVKGSSVFMMSFVPIYSGILVLSGQTVTAVGSSAVLLGAAELAGAFASFVILPVCSAYMALGISSSVSPIDGGKTACEVLKKAMMWCMGGVLTVFVGVLGLQTTVNSAADSMNIRTAKFMVGSFVPVVGSALSESLSTIAGCMKMIKSSAAVYGIVALSAMVFPVIIQTFMWKAVIWASQIITSVFGLKKVSELLTPIQSVLSLLIGVSLFTLSLFVVSVTMLVSMTRGV